MTDNDQKPRTFPINRGFQYKGPAHPLTIPWELAELAYSVYRDRYGASQSLERLAMRGGFGPGEMDEFVPDWRERCDVITTLRAERDRLAGWESFVRPLLRQISDALNIARDEESPGLQCGFLDAIEAIRAERDAALARVKEVEYERDVFRDRELHMSAMYNAEVREKEQLIGEIDKLNSKIDKQRATMQAKLAAAEKELVVTKFNHGVELCAIRVNRNEDITKVLTERDAALMRVKQLEERLQIDPGGSDKIDELELALRMLTVQRDSVLQGVKFAEGVIGPLRKDLAKTKAVLENARGLIKEISLGRLYTIHSSNPDDRTTVLAILEDITAITGAEQTKDIT